MTKTIEPINQQVSSIVNGGSVGTLLTNAGYSSGGVSLPSDFTGTSIGWLVSADGTTFQSLTDYFTGLVVLAPVAAGNSYGLPPFLFDWPWFQPVSNIAEVGPKILRFVFNGG